MKLRSFAFCLVSGLMLSAQGRGVVPADLDRTVKPCQDFFRFANGGWLARNPIPAEYSTWGGFNELAERNRTLLKGILEASAADAKAPKGSVVRQVGDFYAAGMDEAGIEKAGLRPLSEDLALLEGIKDGRGLARVLGRLHVQGYDGGFSFGVGQDDKESTAYIAQLAQDGLGLPDRDDYTQTDASTLKNLAAYRVHVARMFELLGEKAPAAKAHAATVLALETRLAKASMTQVERRDPNTTYNRMSLAELEKLAPGFAWKTYFEAIGLKAGGNLLVRQTAFLKAFADMTRTVAPAEWRTYLRYHVVSKAAPFLPAAFVKENFAFHGTILSGAKEMSARWKRVQEAEDEALGEALGRLYVEKAFSPQAKARVLALVGNLRAVLRERIGKLDWMTASTKEAAIRKLDAFNVKMGYPDTWRDYSSMAVTRDSYLANIKSARAFEFRRGLSKLGRPIDRAEWDMTPPTVNAYYNPNMNEIVFPAGILQPPFFDEGADDAVNYGAIGMVIGHEMTHGFDDQGRQYDAAGNLKDWWTPEDVKAYEARTGLVVKQYDALEALPGLHLNGQLTLGENIADLGGLKIAFAAFQKSLEGKPRPADLDGFTAEQRFFLGYAQSWHFHARDERIRSLVRVDPHSPARFRVNAPLSNLPEFLQAFGCAEGESMVRPLAERPAIW